MQRRWVVSSGYRSAIDAVIKARQERGVTQRELARRLGKPASFTNKIENLERRLDVLEFIAVARALNMAPTELLACVEAALPSEIEI